MRKAITLIQFPFLASAGSQGREVPPPWFPSRICWHLPHLAIQTPYQLGVGILFREQFLPISLSRGGQEVVHFHIRTEGRGNSFPPCNPNARFNTVLSIYDACEPAYTCDYVSAFRFIYILAIRVVNFRVQLQNSSNSGLMQFKNAKKHKRISTSSLNKIQYLSWGII